MSGMSIFNSRIPESQSNPVFNLDWSGFARSSDVEKAATKVAGAVEKGTERMTKAIADDGKNSQKIIDAVKKGSEQVVDAVGKIKSTTNAEQTSPTADVRALCQGLVGISKSTAQIADTALTNPAEIPAALQSAKAISKQFADLIDRASKYAEEGKRFRETAAEAEKATDWIGSNFPSDQCIPITNGAVDVVGAFGRLSDFNYTLNGEKLAVFKGLELERH